MSRPAPLVPADVDLRSFHWFPLHHRRLKRSAFWMRASDQAKAISMELWCEAYEQVPAGSLPDDDVALAAAAGFGKRDLDGWRAVKEEVMSAWKLCSDGRWYHPFLCSVVVERWAEISSRREREREKKRRQRQGKNPAAPASQADVPGGQAGTNAVSPTLEENIGQEMKDSLLTEGDAPLVEPEDEAPDFLFGLDAVDLTPPAPFIPVPAIVPVVPVPVEPVVKDKRGTRLPADWQPTPALVDYGLSKGLTPAEVDAELEEFKLWWPAQAGAKGVKLDWNMTWQTWMVRAAKRKGQGNGGSRTSADRRRDDQDRSRAAMQRGAVEAHQRRGGQRPVG